MFGVRFLQAFEVGVPMRLVIFAKVIQGVPRVNSGMVAVIKVDANRVNTDLLNLLNVDIFNPAFR